jgi:hypothetical protein
MSHRAEKKIYRVFKKELYNGISNVTKMTLSPLSIEEFF